MPSPFPGMDPFVEGDGYFHGIHKGMIYLIREALQAALPEPYYAEMEDRTWVELTNRQVQPDVNVLRAERPTPRRPDEGGGVAVAEEIGTRPVVITIPHEEHHEWYLDVYARFDNREQIVTTIDILSPTNKSTGESSRDRYVQKQKEILGSKIHLVEIDLLRMGTHTTAVPLSYLQAGVKEYDYHVCIHHFDNLEDYFIYPVKLHERLPTIAIPLLPGDGAVPVDLQAVFDRAYDTGPYRRRVLYTDPPPAPALPPDKLAWVQKVLRDKGLLPAAT